MLLWPNGTTIGAAGNVKLPLVPDAVEMLSISAAAPLPVLSVPNAWKSYAVDAVRPDTV
jgi:hypothetical protein